MNLTDDDILRFQKGTPILLEDICAIYPATIGEIIDVGYSKFQQYLSIIITHKPYTSTEDNSDNELTLLLKELSDFQYILMIATLDPKIGEVLREAFKFFTHENAVFLLDPAQIVLGPLEEKHILLEDNFYDFQRIIKRMYFLQQQGEEIIIRNDDDPRVKKLKLKMLENREKVRRAKAKQARQTGQHLDFSDLIGSITLNNCGLNMSNIWNVTYYALQDQLKRMGWRDQFMINNQAALAGAKIKKKELKHWIRSINYSEKS